MIHASSQVNANDLPHSYRPVSRSVQCDLQSVTPVPPTSSSTTQTDAPKASSNSIVNNSCSISEDEEDDDNQENSDDDVDDESAEDETSDSSFHDIGDFEELLGDNHVPNLERKFIVFESCLRMLLSLCFVCMGQCNVYLVRLVGSMVVLRQRCCNGHSREWSSQPCTGSMPYGNLCMAACVFFNGCSPVRFLNVCKHFRLSMISLRTFNLMQSNYLVLAVTNV